MRLAWRKGAEAVGEFAATPPEAATCRASARPRSPGLAVGVLTGEATMHNSDELIRDFIGIHDNDDNNGNNDNNNGNNDNKDIQG